MGLIVEGDPKGYERNESVPYRHRLNDQGAQTAKPIHTKLDGQEVRVRNDANC